MIKEALTRIAVLDLDVGKFSHWACPRTASELVISIRIEDFSDHDHLASYCGVASRNRQSGTSISSVSASRRGNKRLKNLLVFSRNSPVRSGSRFGEHYRRCRGCGMCHGKALKAVARKRLKVDMRDREGQDPVHGLVGRLADSRERAPNGACVGIAESRAGSRIDA